MAPSMKWFYEIRLNTYMCYWLSFSASKWGKAVKRSGTERHLMFPSILRQISSLVTLQLLTQVSHGDQIDAPKYKCAVSMDFICAISRCVCMSANTHLTENENKLRVFSQRICFVCFIFQDCEFWDYQIPLWLPVSPLRKRKRQDTVTERQKRVIYISR